MLPLTSEYLDEIHGVWSHPDVGTCGTKVSREKAAVVVRESEAGFRERGFGICWLVARSSGEGIGFCGFRYSGDAELVYGLLPEYWHRGLATEAARAVIRYGFMRVGLRRGERRHREQRLRARDGEGRYAVRVAPDHRGLKPDGLRAFARGVRP